MSSEAKNLKRPAALDDEDSDDGWIGPTPDQSAAPVKLKKKKVLPYEKVYLENLPNAESYEKSYMHRDCISHLVVTKSDFVITGSVDGHIKFWKKDDCGVEFVKHFRSHLCK